MSQLGHAPIARAHARHGLGAGLNPRKSSQGRPEPRAAHAQIWVWALKGRPAHAGLGKTGRTPQPSQVQVGVCDVPGPTMQVQVTHWARDCQPAAGQVAKSGREPPSTQRQERLRDLDLRPLHAQDRSWELARGPIAAQSGLRAELRTRPPPTWAMLAYAYLRR
jgi:hypothetical protein